MSQSLSKVYVHIVFRTKYGQRIIKNDVEDELYAYIGGILREIKSTSIIINGDEDHIHILCIQSKIMSLAKVLEEIKGGSSKWIKTKGRQYSGFSWQRGYGGFSVSESQIGIVKNYIANQKEHHRKVSFQDEYRKMLIEHDIEFDERYVWD